MVAANAECALKFNLSPGNNEKGQKKESTESHCVLPVTASRGRVPR
jgi:hypothetical protein